MTKNTTFSQGKKLLASVGAVVALTTLGASPAQAAEFSVPNTGITIYTPDLDHWTSSQPAPYLSIPQCVSNSVNNANPRATKPLLEGCFFAVFVIK